MIKLYKNRYMIGIYSLLSEGETLLALVNNHKEFAALLGIKETDASAILSNLFKNKTSYIRFRGRIRTVAFIEEIEDSDKS